MLKFFVSLRPKQERVMQTLEDIIKPVEEPLARLELLLAESLDASSLPMREVMEYLLDTKGKRFRPILVFFAARLFGDINDKTYRVAAFVEMIHTATLLHDDVVDKASVRRGKPSVNAQWDNAFAVLAGDYLLAKALLLLSDPADSDVLRVMLQTSLAMSQGELTHHASLLDLPASSLLPSSSYLSLITQKTALLIRSCCVAAALSVNATVEQVRLVGDFGLNLGLVFQMRDDLLDADEDGMQYAVHAQALLPQYLQNTLDALALLSPFTAHPSSLTSLRDLTHFCASRSL